MSISNLITYNLNSKNRTSGTNDNFSINIDLPADLSRYINKVSVSQICIPKSWYFLQTGNNNLHLYEEVIGSGNKQLINITIPEGNYSKLQLYNKLGSLMTLNSLNGVTYTFTDEHNDYDTGKLKINATNNAIKTYLYFFDNDVYECMGFNKNVEYEFISSIVSVNIINLNRENNIYLKSNIVNNRNNDMITGSSVLCCVYSAGNKDFSYIIQQYNIIDNMKDFINNTSMNFYLTNEDNKAIFLNGVDMSIQINFFTYTPNKTFFDKINNYINYSLIKN
jgi:hypothetical protein